MQCDRLRAVSLRSLLGGVVVLIVSSAAVMSEDEASFPDPILLWPDGAPGAQGNEEPDRPTIRIYKAEKPNGAGVLICPGGGYGALATDHEGHQLAVWYNRIGVTAAVLRYRLGPKYHHPAPLDDAQRGLRYLRSHAEELGLSADRIGVMGFSAGGHLASTLSTHFDAGDAKATDPLERVSCRPDFSVLGYPVISLVEDFGHKGSAKNLLGESPDPALMTLLSNEKQVTPETPRTFIFQTGEDRGVPAENSLAYIAALRKQGVPCELHLYQNGPHGVGTGIGDPVLFSWMDRLHDWLRTNGLLTDAERAGVSGVIKVQGEPLRWGTVTFIPQGSDKQGSDHLPIAWSMVARGKYNVPANRGPTLGEHTVVIRTLGTVVPYPTIADAKEISSPGELTAHIVSGKNKANFALSE